MSDNACQKPGCDGTISEGVELPGVGLQTVEEVAGTTRYRGSCTTCGAKYERYSKTDAWAPEGASETDAP